MMWRVLAVTLGTGWLAVASAEASAFKAAECATDRALSAEERVLLLMQHLPSGVPSDGEVAVRRAYVTAYDPARRVPRWAAWLAWPGYRDTPAQQGFRARAHRTVLHFRGNREASLSMHSCRGSRFRCDGACP